MAHKLLTDIEVQGWGLFNGNLTLGTASTFSKLVFDTSGFDTGEIEVGSFQAMYVDAQDGIFSLMSDSSSQNHTIEGTMGGYVSLNHNGVKKLQTASTGINITGLLYVSSDVGIGTTNPSTVLEVSSSGVNGIDISQSASNATQSGRLFFSTDTASEGFALFNANGTLQINSGGIPNDTSGTNRISIIGSSGNVGIGVTSPAAKLHVDGVIRANSGIYAGDDGYSIGGQAIATFVSGVLTLGDWDDNYFPTRIVDEDNLEVIRVTDGKVGISKPNPSQKLHVNGSAIISSSLAIGSTSVTGTPFRVVNSNAGTTGAIFESTNMMFSGTALEVHSTSNSSTQLIKLRSVNTDRFIVGGLGQIGVGGTNYGTSGQVITSAGSGSAASWQSISNSWTTSGNDIYNNNSGNVGIGTPNPGYTLEVDSGNGLFVGDAGAAVLEANSATGVFSIGDTDELGDGVYATNTGTSNFDIYSTGDVKFRMDVNGNVGIGTGTANPSAKLDIYGNLRLGTTGKLSISQSPFTTSTFYVNTQSGGTVAFGAPAAIQQNVSVNGDLYTAGGSTSNYLGTKIFGSFNNRLNPSGDNYLNSGNLGVGTTNPQSKLQVNGGVQLSNDTAAPTATKVGTFRYYTSGNNSYVDMCMQTGASTYAWVNIVTNSW